MGDPKPHPSLMFFHRDFYLNAKPSLLLSRASRSSTQYRRYRAKYGAAEDTGIGYGFCIFRERLLWHPLMRTNQAEDHYAMAGVYGDLVFHLGAAARGHKVFYSEAVSPSAHPRIRSALWFGRRCLTKLPQKWQDRIIARLFPTHELNEAVQKEIKKKLLADPDAYIRYLRTGTLECVDAAVAR
jgi:hypothetical protein